MSLESETNFSFRTPKYFNCKDTLKDFEINLFLKHGYLVEEFNNTKLIFNLGDENVLDSGLCIGLSQEENIVDIIFIGNKEFENNEEKVIFENTFIFANNKKYKYSKVKIKICNGEAYLVSKDNHECIYRFNNDVYEMVSVVLCNESEEKCVISVINSQICACEINDGQIKQVKPIDIGNNKISDNNTKIRSKSGEEHNISDCYLRKCSKNIYLHVDANPSDTLILGKTDSSTSLSSMDF